MLDLYHLWCCCFAFLLAFHVFHIYNWVFFFLLQTYPMQWKRGFLFLLGAKLLMLFSNWWIRIVSEFYLLLLYRTWNYLKRGWKCGTLYNIVTYFFGGNVHEFDEKTSFMNWGDDINISVIRSYEKMFEIFFSPFPGITVLYRNWIVVKVSFLLKFQNEIFISDFHRLIWKKEKNFNFDKRNYSDIPETNINLIYLCCVYQQFLSIWLRIHLPPYETLPRNK